MTLLPVQHTGQIKLEIFALHKFWRIEDIREMISGNPAPAGLMNLLVLKTKFLTKNSLKNLD